MMHSNRVWSVSEVATAEELAEMLVKTVWCCCSAYRVAGHPDYVWLNDATSEDGAQEYAVCRIGPEEGQLTQIESITFSWCTVDKAERYIRSTLDGHDDDNDWARPVSATIQTAEEHGRCPLCA